MAQAQLDGRQIRLSFGSTPRINGRCCVFGPLGGLLGAGPVIRGALGGPTGEESDKKAGCDDLSTGRISDAAKLGQI